MCFATYLVSRGQQTTARGGCNVRQIAPKIRWKFEKCASQYGRPGMSLKPNMKKKHAERPLLTLPDQHEKDENAKTSPQITKNTGLCHLIEKNAPEDQKKRQNPLMDRAENPKNWMRMLRKLR